MKVHYSDPNAAEQIASGLREAVGSLQPWHLPVYFCIGTPRVQGDALGPYVGDILQRHVRTSLVVGDTETPVTALTLEMLYHNTINQITNAGYLPYWIVVDAAIGDHPGRLTVGKGPINPGARNEFRRLPKVGDAYVLGTTGRMVADLEIPRPGYVEQMAQTIAEGLMQFDRSLNLTRMVTA